jgi:hypothetical protein
MGSKRLSILVPCPLIAIILVFTFLHAHHRHESVAADPPSPPTVAVIAAGVGTIANQLSVAASSSPFRTWMSTARSLVISGISMSTLAIMCTRVRRWPCWRYRSWTPKSRAHKPV